MTRPGAAPAEVETVRCILQRPDGAVLLLQKSPDSTAASLFEFPGGKIDGLAGSEASPAEQTAAAILEVREETGIDLAARPPAKRHEFRYSFDHRGVAYHRRVHVFHAELPDDVEVRVNRTLDAEGRPEDKHRRHVWVSPARLDALRAQGRLSGNSQHFAKALGAGGGLPDAGAGTGRDDHELARHLATEAGRLLLDVRAELADAHVRDREDGGDRRAQAYLAAQLTRYRPDDAVLSEEAYDDGARLDADRVWIIDPLDGTREFGRPGRVDWAVHVALWERGELSAGAVALPARSLTLATPTVPSAPERAGAPRLVVSRSRPPGVATRVSSLLGATLVQMGSAGAKAMAVVHGDADIYLHTGGMYEWDSAAPVAVARAAGLHTSRLDGRPLVYNRSDPYLPDLLICDPRYVDAVLAVTG